jgi:hypothetical protein
VEVEIGIWSWGLIMIRKHEGWMDLWAYIEMRDELGGQQDENMICFWFQVECSFSPVQP